MQEAAARLGDAVPKEPARFLRSPRTVADTGINRELLLSLLVKTIHMTGLERISQLADYLKLSRQVLAELVEEARALALLEVRGSVDGSMSGEMRYGLTAKGQDWALNALNQCQYVGPAPVPFKDFCAQVERQDILKERVSWQTLSKSFNNLVLPEELLHRLGPAVNSGKSILLYGPPGNGKTCIAEAIGRSFQQTVYFPYAIDVDGQTINFFDEMVHHRVDDAANGQAEGLQSHAQAKPDLDLRWVPCRRPIVTTGGELTLGMLDLIFNPLAKFYEAPLQMKAIGGVFVVDDFGRQQNKPQDILNRWIIPLERGVDFLTLHTGKKFPIPFKELVVFSTNIPPSELCDEATLRRLYYKIEVPIPSGEDYCRIFENVCEAHGIPVDSAILPFLFESFYAAKNINLAGYHPTYLIDQVIAMCDYHGVPVHLDKELIRMAWHNLYAT